MNLSKKLLLALAGTGMMAPMAASAQELASLNGAAAINDYMQQQDVDQIEIGCSRNALEHREEAIPPTSTHADSPGKRPWDRL